jgi:zinc transport system permease protein
MDTVINPLELTALGAGLLMALFCGVISPFVLMKRLPFLADTLGHAALLGFGLGFFIGLAPEMTLLPFSVLLAILLTWLSRNRRQDLVSSTAAIFSLAVGMGMLLISHEDMDEHELIHILFGEISNLSGYDILLLLATGIPALFFLWKNRKQITLMTIHEDLAASRNVSVTRLDYLFMVSVAVVIAASIKLVGIILVTGLISLPAMIAGKLSNSLRQQLLLSPAIAIVATTAGMIWSVQYQMPTGACIVTVAGLLFFLTVCLNPAKQ